MIANFSEVGSTNRLWWPDLTWPGIFFLQNVRNECLGKVTNRVVLDLWVMSQIWLDSDSNELSRVESVVKNQGLESSQSRVTLMVIWVRVECESTRYCLNLSHWFCQGENANILTQPEALNRTSSYIWPQPPPRSKTFGEIRQNVMSHESYLTQISLILIQMSWVRLGNLGFELNQSWVNQ